MSTDVQAEPIRKHLVEASIEFWHATGFDSRRSLHLVRLKRPVRGMIAHLDLDGAGALITRYRYAVVSGQAERRPGSAG